MLNAPLVTVVVVTFNRRTELRACLSAIANQSLPCTAMIVVDNASTDGTHEQLQADGWLKSKVFDYLLLKENTGGAGGFAAGVERALERGTGWIWMMDDDAVPHPNALEELMRVASNPRSVYGSLATCAGTPSWTTTLMGPPITKLEKTTDAPASGRVPFLPFLGILVHSDLVRKIGPPDAGFFIAADDLEYCLRAEAAGAELVLAGKSWIEHPRARSYTLRFFRRRLVCVELPPWKKYYDTRNRILIARRYFGNRLVTQTLPGLLLRISATLCREPNRGAQLRAFICGVIDGLRGLKGRRHSDWGIS